MTDTVPVLLTEPPPVKVRVLPPLMLAGPLRTEKLTDKPLVAVALKVTTLVLH